MYAAVRMIVVQQEKFMSRNLFIIRSSCCHHYKQKLTTFFSDCYQPWWSQCPRCLRPGSVAARWLGLRARISPGASMSLSWECCMLSGNGLCVCLISRPEESYRLWCVWVWSWSLGNEEILAHLGLLCQEKSTNLIEIQYGHPRVARQISIFRFPATCCEECCDYVAIVYLMRSFICCWISLFLTS